MRNVRHFYPLRYCPHIPRPAHPHRARYNVAPGQSIPVVRTQPGPRARQIVEMHWGLVPSWATDPAIGHRMINARTETAAQKPAFREAFKHRRCLIPVDGFYEWTHAAGRKQPYFIRLKDPGVFALAGLWETWRKPDRTALESCTILTTAANNLIKPLHDRMPVILAPPTHDQWLDPAAPLTICKVSHPL